MSMAAWRRDVSAGAAYFALTFAVGALVGPVREVMLKPLVGETGALLVEAPLMIAAMALIAARVVARFGVSSTRPARIIMGGVALALLLVAEMALTYLLRHISPAVWVAHFWSREGMISATLYALFAMMPVALLVVREGRPT